MLPLPRDRDPVADPLDAVDLRARVDKALGEFLERQRARLDEVGPDLGPVGDAVTSFVLAGGKRLRPAFGYWGWRGAGGDDREEAVRTVAALELLHAAALVHDDVMDASDTRRGRPAVHRQFAALHRGAGWRGSPEGFGGAAAVLVGDLCLVWADSMVAGGGFDAAALHRARPVFDGLRREMLAGQYLDLLEQAYGETTLDRALRVARYKTAKYTVERPLHFGAALAGASEPTLRTYTAYGLPLGEAFQLRDDVLGVFGDPQTTGKPAGDDLREGKRTALVALAEQRATPGQATVLRRHLGDPALDDEGLARLRAVLLETGALATVERIVTERVERALAALAGAELAGEAGRALARLAEVAVAR